MAANASSAQASEQIKQGLRWMVRNRFWIVLALSALLPVIGYVVGAGPIQKATADEVGKIKGADSGLSGYLSGSVANDQWKPLVDEKKEVLTKDVNKAWERLYAVQAPLLKWPDVVESRFHEWGRKWPENVDLGAVQKAIDDFVNAYEKEVDQTYSKVNPWNVETGKGVVVAPDKLVLLRPSVFDPANPPTLNQVWSAQERLWVQGTMLDAVAKINGKAKDWDGAVVKQVNSLEVGSPVAQDQKSLVEGKTVEPSPEIVPPGGTPTTAPEAPAAPGAPPGAPGGMGSGGMPNSPGATEPVYLLKTDSTQYTIVPVMMDVLVDQNRLQDFLVGLENSPMAIQVLEFEMFKPVNPVTKPVKGEAPVGMGMFGPGIAGGDPRMMMRGGMMGGMRPGEGSMFGPGMAGGDPRMMMRGGMMGGAPAGKKGTDVRDKERAKEREEREKKRKALGRAIDTYYDIVEVTVYGQARFYNPPPPPPAAEPASPGAPAAEEPKPAEAKKEETPGEPKAADASKKEEAKPAEAKEEAKPAAKEEAKPAEPSADQPKAEAKPAEPPKAEAKPAEPPAPDATKPAEPPKA